ncbi:protein of unknown function [Legionella micdadei]|uniref:Uncharacterized protein n=1 Tax=Legionella micdadei TaxID=451 RepID=A0A098GG89_LEGMI|nr:protein of unknown function [Legionella micdadei]
MKSGLGLQTQTRPLPIALLDNTYLAKSLCLNNRVYYVR